LGVVASFDVVRAIADPHHLDRGDCADALLVAGDAFFLTLAAR
jgi:hypothetical protein